MNIHPPPPRNDALATALGANEKDHDQNLGETRAWESLQQKLRTLYAFATFFPEVINVLPT